MTELVNGILNILLLKKEKESISMIRRELEDAK